MSEKPWTLAVKALIVDSQDRCLLIRRAGISKHFRYKWDLPGGKLDPGESFDVALQREVQEETGLQAIVTGVAGAVEYDMPAVRVAILFLVCKAAPGEVQLSAEHDQYAWVPRNEILDADLSEQLRGFLETHRI